MSLAIVFPGQGSQSVGMLGELAATHSLVAETFGEASEALEYDLWALCQNGPAERINATSVTQPAMLAAGVAAFRVWKAEGGSDPDFFAGHSLGEYTALVCANAIDFAIATRLVEFRATAMQSAVPEGIGAMAAIIGLDNEQVIAACESSADGEVVEAVNFNAPGQVVIAGHASAVKRANDKALELGARKAIALPVSVPSHCALMRSAAEELAGRLAETEIRVPGVPVVHNAGVATHADTDEIRGALVKQLYQPVRWVECVESMIGGGADIMLECGPGKVLAGLNKRINRAVPTYPVFDDASLSKALEERR